MRLALLASWIVIESFTAAVRADDVVTSSFNDVVRRHFDRWDGNGDGNLEAGEVNPRLVDPGIRGVEAAALASVHMYQRRVKSDEGKRTWPPLSQEFLLRSRAEYEEARRDVETAVPNFHLWFDDFAGRIERRQSQLFAADAPSLVGFKQGRLGDCFFLAVVGSAVHRSPERVRNMIRHETDGSYRVAFGDGKTVELPHLTDGHLVLGSSVGEQGLWLNVLEVAFARRWLETRELSRPDELSLDVLSRGGLSRQVVPILTGHEAKLTLLREKPSEPPTAEYAARKEAEVAELLTTARRERRLTMTGTLTVKPLPAGIPGNHVLAVLDYDPQHRTVEVWNPWCNNRTPPGEPGLVNGYVTQGGRFTMPLAEFVRTFNSLTYETDEPAAPPGARPHAPPAGSRVLWDGDTAETSQINQLGELSDGGVTGKCLAANWPASGKRINPVIVFGKSRPDVDLQGFDELWFQVKASEPGKTFAVELRQWSGRMARAEIDRYLDEGKLTTEWQWARIPLPEFRPNATWQNVVDHIIFNDVERNPTSRQNRALLPKHLYLDDMYLVKRPK